MTGWSVETLKELVQSKLDDAEKRNGQRFEAQEKAVASALQAAKEAVAKAEIAAEKRFDSVNEFRAQLSDQAGTFMPRLEAEQRIAQQAEKLDALASRMDSREGKSVGMGAFVPLLISGLGLLVAIGMIAVVATK